MRLWHEDLFTELSKQRILGQHREICGMRGAGWGQNHSTVNYVWDYRPVRLLIFHRRLMDIGGKRFGIKFTSEWFNPHYRGKNLGFDESDNWLTPSEEIDFETDNGDPFPIYLEHDDEYLEECVDNLQEKGIELEVEV